MHSSYKKRAAAYVLVFIMVLTTAFSNTTFFVNATEDNNTRFEVIDDFESYADAAAVGKAWQPHYWGCDPVNADVATGVSYSQAMKYEYSWDEKGYVGLYKNGTYKTGDYEGISIWCKPDGSGNLLTVQLTVGEAVYKYEDSTTLKGTTATTLKIPFDKFVDGDGNSVAGKSVSSE